MKPRIKIIYWDGHYWQCKGARPPYKNACYGYGATPSEAYERWISDPIPF